MTVDRAGGLARTQVPARVLDLSEGGARLSLPARLEVGEFYDFVLELPGGALWAQAEIRWCEPAPGGDGFLLGVQFVGIDPQDEKRLRAELQRMR